MCWRCRGC
uniref:Uncharacterized protein n=1 Tax=Arundo donax TaxID=35708 RepID=A0A0A9FTG4_ARUDO